jgi:hypothetical protein
MAIASLLLLYYSVQMLMVIQTAGRFVLLKNEGCFLLGWVGQEDKKKKKKNAGLESIHLVAYFAEISGLVR